MVVTALALLAVGCGSGGSEGREPLDLGRLLDQAECRPRDASFGVTDVVHGDDVQSALIVPATSRITWEVAVPDRAVLRTGAALPADGWTDGVGEVLFRIGVADSRVYEELHQERIPAGPPSTRRWTPITVDLARYGGFKWSLFYRPRSIRWKVTFNAGVTGRGTPGASAERVLWMRPMITAR